MKKYLFSLICVVFVIVNLLFAKTGLAMEPPPEDGIGGSMLTLAEQPGSQYAFVAIAGEGGRVTPESGYFRAGVIVCVKAEVIDHDYVFDSWQCETENIWHDQISETSFSMPRSDVRLRANFTQKPKAGITYEGAAVAFPFDGSPKAPALLGLQAENGQVEYVYRAEGEAGAILPDMPTQAGTYHVTAIYRSFLGSRYRTSTAATLFTIQKSEWEKPAPPSLTSGESAITVQVIGEQAYLLLPATENAPVAGDSRWRQGNGDESITWTGLTPGLAYQVYTYIPASGDRGESPVSDPAQCVAGHVWRIFADEDCKFSAYTNDGGAQPAAKAIMVKNQSSGRIAGLRAALSGPDEACFAFVSNPENAPIQPGEVVEFCIQPIAGLGKGSYRAQVLIDAEQAEAGFSAALAREVVAVELEVIDAPAAPTPGGEESSGPGRAPEPPDSLTVFWSATKAAIETAPLGSTVKINAMDDCQIPGEVLVALIRAKEVSLLIKWNGGEDLLIQGQSLILPEPHAQFYPLADLGRYYVIEPPQIHIGKEEARAQSKNNAHAAEAVPPATVAAPEEHMPGAANQKGLQKPIAVKALPATLAETAAAGKPKFAGTPDTTPQESAAILGIIRNSPDKMHGALTILGHCILLFGGITFALGLSRRRDRAN